MARKYYTLLERTDGQWVIAFGDYDRQVVAAEGDDMRDHGTRAKDLKIICTTADQPAIDWAVAQINERLGQ